MIIRPNQPSNPKTGTGENQSQPKPFSNRNTPPPTNKPPQPKSCSSCGI